MHVLGVTQGWRPPLYPFCCDDSTGGISSQGRGQGITRQNLPAVLHITPAIVLLFWTKLEPAQRQSLPLQAWGSGLALLTFILPSLNGSVPEMASILGSDSVWKSCNRALHTLNTLWSWSSQSASGLQFWFRACSTGQYFVPERRITTKPGWVWLALGYVYQCVVLQKWRERKEVRAPTSGMGLVEKGIGSGS